MRKTVTVVVLAICSLLCPSCSAHQRPSDRQGGLAAAPARVQSAKIEILSTMLAERGIGEWGFSALVEADGRRILFDTGQRSNVVLDNSGELDIDLSTVTDVVLSHFHGDHTGGLLTLRRELSKKNADAISRVHVAKGIFRRRRSAGGQREANSMIEVKIAFEALGGVFVEHDRPAEVLPGVWVTGPVPRVHSERNWSGNLLIEDGGGWVEDTIPESQALLLDTREGLILLSGCGHAGLINTVDFARSRFEMAPIYAAVGGFHLLDSTDEHLAWTAEKLRNAGLQHFLGAHCTGIEAVYQIREAVRLTRGTCVVGAVGASYSLEGGIQPLSLAK